MLDGREFLLFTDHKPLTSSVFRISLPLTAQQQRHLAYISEFTSSIVHMPGLENTEAEALSCPVPVSVPAPNPVEPCFSPNSQSNPSSVSPGSVKPNTALRCESNMCYAIPCLVKQSSILKPKPVSISCSPVLNSDNCSGFLCSMF